MIQIENYNASMKVKKVKTNLLFIKERDFCNIKQTYLSFMTKPLKPILYAVTWEQASDTLQISTSINGPTIGHEYNTVQK